ncbi:hypothetical protein OAX78_00990 [Planctomycetota bacterium]|nr:hypothetical protein [Planctomycetota bacterium]
MGKGPFELDRYLIRRKVFKLFGGAFHIYDPDQQLVYFYAEQKAFKLKEDFTVFGDEAKTKPLLRIKARSIIDISATYDITDAKTGDVVGACRRKGLKSILQDEWEVLDGDENVIAIAKEDSMLLALVRRLLSKLVPQSFVVRNPREETVAEFNQSFNPFVFKMNLDYSHDRNGDLDRRLGIGLAVCMMAIEGRQN